MKRVMSFGVFDLLHYGHINAIKKAKALGDFLVIGVFSDEVATSFKRKPILNEVERAINIEALGLADKVFILDNFDPTHDIAFYNIDIVAKAEGAGWEKGCVPQFLGAKSLLLDYTEGISTSEIIKRIKERNDLC